MYTCVGSTATVRVAISGQAGQQGLLQGPKLGMPRIPQCSMCPTWIMVIRPTMWSAQDSYNNQGLELEQQTLGFIEDISIVRWAL